MGDTAGIRKETEALDRLRGQPEEFPVGAVLQRAAGHPRLVADAWIECVKNWHPFEWIAVFQTDGDGRRIVLRETGRQPNELPVSSMHCEQCRAGAIDWIPITESSGNSVHLAVAVPESDAYPAVLSEMRRWIPVAGLAFRHAELNLEASHHCACLDHTEAPAETVDECLTQSPAMEAVLAEVQRIKDGRSAVTIIGEAGSGKAHLAHLMHRMSSRRHAPVVDVSGSDFSDAEGEPFGNGESGSKVDRDGAGMIVLKDIHTAPAAVQQRLARRLERLADIATPVPRIVALFDRDPAEFVRKGSLAEELYDRLNGATIRLPALRERREDIPLLARHFAGQFLAAGVPEPVITAPAMEVLVSYDWPGNIRELQNEVKRAVAAVSAEPLPAVTPADLDERITAARSRRAPRDAADRKELDDVLAGTEKRVIEDALRTNNGQVSASAEALGLTRQGLYKKVKRLGIHLAQFQEETAEAHE